MKIESAVVAQAPENPSLEAFYKAMDAGPKTWGWDALLVFSRSATNALLSQEYIDRAHIPELFFPALPDGIVDSGNGIDYVLLGLRLDKARLSFENANLKTPKAKLQMRLVGGKHLEVIETFLDGKPVRSVQALILYNAVTHAVLDMNITLDAVVGTVDESGKVLLDINKGYDHLFSGGGTGPERVRLGLYFKDLFKTWAKEKKEMLQFPLSELAVDDTSLLNPGVFMLGTHAEPGATVLGSANQGDGAVVVFVAMRGNPSGGYPPEDKDLLYMLPDSPNPYTSNLVLSHKLVAQHVVKLGFDQFDWMKGKFDLKALKDDLYQVDVNRYKLVANAMSGGAYAEIDYSDANNGGTLQPWRWRLNMVGATINLFDEGSEVVFDKRMLKINWSSAMPVGTLVYWLQTGNSGGETIPLQVSAKVEIRADCKFDLSQDANKTTLNFSVSNFRSSVEISIQDGFRSGNGGNDARARSENLKAPLEAALIKAAKDKLDSLKNMTFEIDALRLNQLLFRGDNVVDPRDVAVPNDLTLLGNLAPKRTAMSITPLEPIVASGGFIDFSASSTSGITWTVENLPGETGETGKFATPSVGRYTAPSDDALVTEGQRRVIVTATSGEQVSRALVSIVPSHVSVNPWVAVVGLGKNYALSAGTPDKAELKWNQPTLGKVDKDTDPLNPGGQRYTAPTTLPKREPTQPNHYRVLRLDEVTVEPAAGGTPATIDMLVVGAKSPNYWIEPAVNADGSVALPFYRIDMDMEKVKVPEPIEWKVLRGSGTIDSKTQTYTPAPGSDDKYVIVSAFYVNDSPDTHDYVILPLPFVPVRNYAEILSPTIKEV
ncbi:hypothetical protein ACSFEV_16615 [Pseudomonas fulva]|uniref:hypothetical protein n=1 Tax=Pseudomonas putida group TaxID=136845 RepID=UPI0018AA7416|nr:hypothetical protein [Pseudomonas putida]MBF8727940.1 hypothetical protein [Pseudomonas putida]